MGGITPEYHEFLSFLTIFHSLNEFTSISREIKKFELQVCYSLAPKLYKNHQTVICYDCRILERKKYENVTTSYDWSNRQFWPCFEKTLINGENIRKM